MKLYSLFELGTIVTGNTPPKKVKEYYESNDIKFVKPNDISNKNISYIEETTDFISEKARERARIVPCNSVLITCIGIIGKVAITKGDVAFNQQINAIIPNEKVLPEYLALKLKQEQNLLKKLANKSIVANINKTNFSNIKISIPSIEEQYKVVDLSLKLITLIKKRQRQIEALSALKQSIFLDMFGDPVTNERSWDTKILNELGKWKSGGTPSRKKAEYFQGDIPWLSSGELNNIYVYDSEERITETAIEESSSKMIEENSLLLGMYDTAGLKSSINKVKCSCNQAIAFAKINERIASTEFVYYSIQIMREYLLNQQRGVRQKNFNLTMIKNIEVILPPLELQNEFSNRLKDIINFEVMLNNSLYYYNNLFNNLLHKAFNGELFKEGMKV